MKLKKYFIIIGLLLLIPFFASAQKGNPLRIEVELPHDATDYKVIPIEKDGVIAFYEGRGSHADSSTWVFIQYDTNLKKQRNFVVHTPANLIYNIAMYDNENIYLFLIDKFQKKTSLNSYFLTLNFHTGDVNFSIINGFYDENINFIKKTDDKFILISYLKKEYAIYQYDRLTNQVSSLKLTHEPIRSIEFCEVDTFSRQLLWGLVLEMSTNSTVMHYVVTDYNGKAISKLPFPRYTGFNYMTARLTVIDSADALILGTYVRDEDKGKSNLPTGIYTMPVNGLLPQDPEFFSESQIKSKDATVVKQVKNDQNLQMLVGDIRKVNGGYALISETFYPEYEYSSYSYGYDPFNPNARSGPVSNFLGYRFVSASVTAFDENGELIWNQYMPFRNVLTLNLFPRISTFEFQKYTVIYYIFNASFSYTMVDKFDVIEPVTTKSIALTNSNEAVDYSRNVQMDNWYGNYFLISGYQALKGKTRSSKGKRYVFYMNKLEYR